MSVIIKSKNCTGLMGTALISALSHLFAGKEDKK